MLNVRTVNQLILAAIFLAALALSVCGQAKNGAEVYAIRNARVVTVTGATIERGTVVIRDGRIAAVGANASVPSNAKVIDAAGLAVYPGLIDSDTTLGLQEISSVAGTVDTTEIGDFKANMKAITAVNPHSELIPVARANGITTVLAVPQGGLISGQAALINLDGWTPTEMALKASAAVRMNYPKLSVPSRGSFFAVGGNASDAARQQRDRQLESLRKKLEDAQAYLRAKEAAAQDKNIPARTVDLGLEALIPALKGEVPVIMSADTEREIRGAVELADKFKLRLVISGGDDAPKVAALLKEKNIPVIVGPVLALPANEDDPYDRQYALAGELHRAGVRFAISTGNGTPNGPGDVRLLPFQAGTAAAFGLPKDEALKAVTIYPAQIFGVEKLVGSVEEGKLANLIVTDGDPLEFRTKVKHLFINGRPVDLATKHTRLYEKFSGRP
jgi:imidazolonepropionase-like amidohydrolase